MTSIFKISTFKSTGVSAKMHVDANRNAGIGVRVSACGVRPGGIWRVGTRFHFYLVTVRGVLTRDDVCVRCRRFVERSL